MNIFEKSSYEKYRDDDFSCRISRRFRTNSVTNFCSRGATKASIMFSRIEISQSHGMWTDPQQPEAAFAVHVNLTLLPRLDTRIDGKNVRLGATHAGEVFVYDLATSPSTLIQDPLDCLRMQISQRALDELAYQYGRPQIAALRPTLGAEDPVLHGLSQALLERAKIYGVQNDLFLDHVALAFHAHVAQTYGQIGDVRQLRGGLAPWQYRRAIEIMVARLSEGTTLAELAEACSLSTAYFARAFKRTAGIPAHQWLMKERIGRAKDLLLNGDMSVAQIAVTCGFADQSHFTRVFFRFESQTPVRWKKLRLE